MYNCDSLRELLYPYLDGELDVDIKEVIRVESHLKECCACRDLFTREKEFLDLLKESSPVSRVVAPEEVRRELFRKLRSTFYPEPQKSFTYRLGPVFAFSLVLLLVAGFTFSVSSNLFEKKSTPELLRSAVNQHKKYMEGRVPLDFTVKEPSEVGPWFQGKVGFPVHHPSELGDGFSIEGGGLVNSDNLQVAFLAYTYGKEKVSLAVTTSSYPGKLSGEGGIPFKGLIFYPNLHKGLHTISWSDQGLSYVLVANKSDIVKEACAICHGGSPDELKKIEGFKERGV